MLNSRKGPQIKCLLRNGKCENLLSDVEKSVCNSLRGVIQNLFRKL